MGEIDHKAKFYGPIKPSLCWRYRDDIFDLWQQGPSALNSSREFFYCAEFLVQGTCYFCAGVCTQVPWIGNLLLIV